MATVNYALLRRRIAEMQTAVEMRVTTGPDYVSHMLTPFSTPGEPIWLNAIWQSDLLVWDLITRLDRYIAEMHTPLQMRALQRRRVRVYRLITHLLVRIAYLEEWSTDYAPLEAR